MNILITGAGSVMGQSIYKALAMYDFGEPLNIHFANSEELGAGRFFSLPTAPVVQKPIFPLAADSGYLDHLKQYVADHNIDIVFAGTQHELAKISAYRDESLKAATISSKIAEICMDKVRTSSVLSRHSIRVPFTCTLEEYLASEQFNGPVVVKPNHSSSSRSIFRLDGKSEAQRLVDEQVLRSASFLVQERLEGDEYTCGCYVDRYTGDINTIIFRRTLTPDGATSYGEIVQSPTIQQYVTNVGRALVAEGMDFGHVNVQLILTETGPVLFEINGRLSSTEASKAHYGYNSCAAFVSNIVQQKPFFGWNVAKLGRFLRYYEEIYFD
ncbi:ATP-grasp domain-containing protein [Achromobacter xylosoxidans]|jgi:carbamoyl-phosphate synthase large subunit|uniref:ATP-grasp domain-containing protein n=1 Tax=Alcaligenes xylosoxydans xylosoxydans TaxID=85698 RepID=A0A9W5AI78_ALCXX|nr:ATP-grasp domain-containing protein [Achromobacter xylosoxidans]MCZ8400539.1 ATP-grasp domain-containing protein [Achromobacter xylosoxidans]CUJ56063.1 carbamoyl phosphate synthase-like protein [Achromobacter xylosoxidans]